MSPLLSELSFSPRLVKVIQNPLLRVRGALFAFLVGVFLAGLSILSGAHAIRATISGPQVDKEINGRVIQPANIWYGYCVELNHGLFGITLAPCLIFLYVWLIQEITDSVDSLVQRRRLISNNQNVEEDKKAVRDTLAEWNKRVCGFFFVPIAFLIFVFVIGSELLSLDKPILGWVQAGIAQSLNGATVNGLEHRDMLVQLPDVKRLYKEEPPFDKMPIKISGGVPSGWRHCLFLCLVFITQSWHAILITIGSWLALKAGFLCVLLWLSVPVNAPANKSIKVEANLEDDKNRYGLAFMDDFYDLVLATALVCSIDFSFSYLSNASKGRANASQTA